MFFEAFGKILGYRNNNITNSANPITMKPDLLRRGIGQRKEENSHNGHELPALGDVVEENLHKLASNFPFIQGVKSRRFKAFSGVF